MEFGTHSHWTRRTWLKAVGASVALLPAPGIGLAIDDPNPYAPFKMGIQSYSLRGYKTLREALQKTKDLGLHYWESYAAHIPTSAESAPSDKAVAEEFGVHVVGFGVIRFTNDR